MKTVIKEKYAIAMFGPDNKPSQWWSEFGFGDSRFDTGMGRVKTYCDHEDAQKQICHIVSRQIRENGFCGNLGIVECLEKTVKTVSFPELPEPGNTK